MSQSMVNALFSIKPSYAKEILCGSKRVEYRKKRCKQEIGRIFIYATKPIAAIVGEVTVVGILSQPPSVLWESTQECSGISKEAFFQYFEGCPTAYAYQLKCAIEYKKPIPLRAVGISTPPQSYCYLSENQVAAILCGSM